MVKNADRAELVIRMPRAIKAWIEQQAARNGSSQNSEVIKSLRARMDEQLERISN